MGKIPVQELARIMGIANQDLIFKLRSIGVRVEGDDAHIDTEVIQAFLQGKKLPQPREVILRDEATPEAAVRRGAPPRRLPMNPMRPTRPRSVIQRVEPRIRTIPATERAPAPAPPAATASLAPSSEAAAPAPPAPAAREGVARPAVPSRPAPPPAAPPRRPLGPPPARPTGVPSPAEKALAEEKQRERERKAKRGLKKPAPVPGEGEDLRAYVGSVDEIEAAREERETAPEVTPAAGRRRRRAERKEDEGGKVLAFKKAPPQGPVTISEGMTLRDFSEKLGVKAKDLIKLLFDRGIAATINHVLEPELAQQLAVDLGVEAMVVTFEEEVQLKRELDAKAPVEGKLPRAPVVTIMGHVDHGKTSLLDAIRSSKLTEAEFGGITQHIGAYQVEVNGRKIVFLDTPGHEAFTMMRARGARVTDLVVLVVAADDGVMPQTIEAINHARAAKVPMVVAVNKIDKPNANQDRVKKELADQGITVEEWGGDVVAVPVSALRKQGINELLEMILLTADILELRANPELPAEGVVLEARKEVGRGVVGTVLVKNGTLRVGDVFVAGATWGRVRAMSDDLGQRSDVAGPATPAEVTGFSEVPAAGDAFQVVEEEAKARSIVEFRRQEQRKRELAPTQAAVSLEQLFDQIQQGSIKELPVVLKADVQGSVEVLHDTLHKLSTDKVKVNVIHAGVGAISTNDVLLASASKAIVLGFNVRPERNAAELADKEGVDIRLHTVIYELADELRKAMTGLLEPTFREVARGRAEVRETFKVPKVGTVAGCHVVEGVIPRAASVRLLRDNRVVYEGRIGSLRRFKDDVAEVRSGFDCGIGLERFNDVKPGDSIEAYVREEVAPTL
jgi:translation initiation factor IF-2